MTRAPCYATMGNTNNPLQVRQVFDWDSGQYLGDIPEAPHTYNVGKSPWESFLQWGWRGHWDNSKTKMEANLRH